MVSRNALSFRFMKDCCTQSMNVFIEQLLRIDAVPSADYVFYLCSTYGEEEVLELVRLSELEKDIEAPAYDLAGISGLPCG